jgi:hypothetical protein
MYVFTGLRLRSCGTAPPASLAHLTAHGLAPAPRNTLTSSQLVGLRGGHSLRHQLLLVAQLLTSCPLALHPCPSQSTPRPLSPHPSSNLTPPFHFTPHPSHLTPHGLAPAPRYTRRTSQLVGPRGRHSFRHQLLLVAQRMLTLRHRDGHTQGRVRGRRQRGVFVAGGRGGVIASQVSLWAFKALVLAQSEHSQQTCEMQKMVCRLGQLDCLRLTVPCSAQCICYAQLKRTLHASTPCLWP